MKNDLLPRFVVAAALGCTGPVLSASDSVAGPNDSPAESRRVDEQRPANAKGRVTIENVAGSIEVIAWDQPAVRVAGTLGPGIERMDFASDGDATRVKVVYPSGLRQRSGGAQLTIHVPAGSRIEVQSVSADLRLRGVHGPLEIQTTSGDIQVESSPAEVRVETVSGDIHVEGDVQSAKIRSVSGSFVAKGGLSTLDATLVSGDVELSGVKLGAAEVQTVSGDIRLEGALVGDKEIEFQTQSGEVELELAPGTTFRPELSSRSGEIVNELKASSGSGPRLSIQTMSGDIRIRRSRSGAE